MYFYNLHGKKVKLKQPYKYNIDWEGKSRSKFQSNIKKLLHSIWSAEVVFEEFPVIGTRMKIDFYNPYRREAIEVDGEQHNKYNKFFHGKSKLKFIEHLKRDNDKEIFCEKNNIKLVRICESDKIENVERLVEFIENYGKE